MDPAIESNSENQAAPSERLSKVLERILQKQKDSPVLWFLIAVAGAFSVGFAAYPSIMLTAFHKVTIDASDLAEKDQSVGELKAVSAERNGLKEDLQRLENSQATEYFRTGTAKTAPIEISAVDYARTASIRAVAAAHLFDGGTLTLEVEGAAVGCRAEKYRNSTVGPDFDAEVICPEEIPAGETRSYVANARNTNAEAVSVALAVTTKRK